MLNQATLLFSAKLVGEICLEVESLGSGPFNNPIIVTTDYGTFQLTWTKGDNGWEYHYLKGNYIESIDFSHSAGQQSVDVFLIGEDGVKEFLASTSRIAPNVYHHLDVPKPLDFVPGDFYKFRLNCYLKGTIITLADGSHKLVENLTYDDEILVWDFDNGCFSSAKALWITKPQIANHYYRLKFSDGTELQLVGSDGKCHRLLNIENGEFTYGSYFRVGQHTFKEDESTPHLVSIELIEEEVEFYNVATHYHMNCFANGVLSSCGYNNMYPIKDMKFVKDGREIIPFETYTNIPKQFYDSLRLGEQDLSKRSVEKAEKYIGRLLKVIK